MHSVDIGLNIFISLNFILLIIGLFKPWIVLWWEDSQYRLKVIKLYGTVIGTTLIIKLLLNLIIKIS